jgi:hypothetical protein
MNISYDNKRFASVSTTENGEVSGETIFQYHQKDDIVWAEYSGGEIVLGNLIATVSENGILDMRYQHVNTHSELMTGICTSTPELLPDGRIRLHEQWKWTSGDLSTGTSTIEEIL